LPRARHSGKILPYCTHFHCFRPRSPRLMSCSSCSSVASKSETWKLIHLRCLCCLGCGLRSSKQRVTRCAYERSIIRYSITLKCFMLLRASICFEPPYYLIVWLLKYLGLPIDSSIAQILRRISTSISTGTGTTTNHTDLGSRLWQQLKTQSLARGVIKPCSADVIIRFPHPH
jgi:hypothetical protein